jgi:hypothetical protein
MCVGTPWVGAPCDDGNLCNVGDVCDASGSCHAVEELECDDLLICNGQETCELALGCVPGVPLVCGGACPGETGVCSEPFGCGSAGCAGQAVRIGFTAITDCAGMNDGWFLDDVAVTACMP